MSITVIILGAIRKSRPVTEPIETVEKSSQGQTKTDPECAETRSELVDIFCGTPLGVFQIKKTFAESRV